jgi:hypothetical protein
MPDRTSLISDLVGFCKGSRKKVAILEAVRKPRNYEQVAKITGADKTVCSDTLNRLAGIGAVEPLNGRRGYFRQTPVMKSINIRSELVKAGNTRRPRRTAEPEMVKETVRIFEIEKAADFLDLEASIRNDCFPPRKPYGKDVGYAYLILEETLRTEAEIPRGVTGIKLVSAAAAKGLFNREVVAERDGLVSIFNGAFGWLRNPSHHAKGNVSKEEAIKLVLFADYLIKVVRKLKIENQEALDRMKNLGN